MPKKIRPSMVPLNKICAVMCNYKRPKNARKVVKQLKRFGIKEIIVWNNRAKPIPEATKNINQPTNIGPRGKYLAGLHTKKPYVLITDDDNLITKAGLDALRKWASFYPVVSQVGDIYLAFNPINGHRKRKRYHSHEVSKPKRVDYVLPYLGMMVKTSLYRRVNQHWAWGSLKCVSPGYFFTDQPMNFALWEMSGQRPVVVPCKNGYVHLPEETKGAALSKQTGRYKEFVKIWRWMINNGWKFMKINPLSTSSPDVYVSNPSLPDG